MRPKQKRAHVQQHEKRFKFHKRAGNRGCKSCYDPAEYRGTRPKRREAVRRGVFEEALDYRWTRDIMHWHCPQPRQNLHNHSTRMNETYRLLGRRKRSLKGD
ncbi:MAG TPA: hypothetical protein VKK79_06410 [Candidatus Lokiarchaeia archaeon]|nr:hypothetical protein [Candidatus Lokiarchaeia archaeon]